jgi:2-polyprenyl-3-methyl-5-hydroxy-6-metoxy-1,4-benzoquinol methylase
MIDSIKDREEYRKKVRSSWKNNSNYWLSSELRHVTDVGEYIVKFVIEACKCFSVSKPTIIDMGFGNAWLYRALKDSNFMCNYIGIDSNEYFIHHARDLFSKDKFCRFELTDIEEPLDLDIKGHLVINAFNLFELSSIQQPMVNAYNMLFPGGQFLISTIDCTYLILAISSSWADFFHNLSEYEKLPGIKYAFQPIDLGDRASDSLEYPSVLYSREDYLNEAMRVGFNFSSYKENVFTSKPIPKIYYHLLFAKGGEDAKIINR